MMLLTQHNMTKIVKNIFINNLRIVILMSENSRK